MNLNIKTKYTIDFTSNFKKHYKRNIKQGKDVNKFIKVLEKIANGEKLEDQYKEHKLINDKYYKNCYECHIEPDWLLIYQILDEKLILLLIDIGSHSSLFK